jgi:hypothetical protein
MSETPPHESFDSEISVRGITVFLVGLLVACVLVLLAMWMMVERFRESSMAEDRPDSPVAEANRPPARPATSLQESPVKDMDELRANDESVLTSYGWVDPANGVARIPITRAMQLLAEKARAKPATGTPAGSK